jgi:hypothetical protein
MVFIKLFYLIISVSFSVESRLIYEPKSFGSESQFNPISLYFNDAFDTIQNPNYFSQKDYLKKHETVWREIKDPFVGIKKGGGLKVLLRDEFVPFAPRAIPNYTLHLIGGGYDFRKLAEWFDVNNYSHPYVWAFAIKYATHFGNEAIESTNTKDIGPHDHIADLYFFDIVGKFMFMNDEVVKFFRDQARLDIWRFQPMFDFKEQQILNAGVNYIVRPNIFKSENWRPFIHAGLQIMGGATYLKNSEGYTFAMGISPTDPLRNKQRLVSGFFWDRAGSLMTSLYINGSENQKFRLNIFPGIINFNSVSPGVFTALQRNNDWQIGVQALIPIGVGARF